MRSTFNSSKRGKQGRQIPTRPLKQKKQTSCLALCIWGLLTLSLCLFLGVVYVFILRHNPLFGDEYKPYILGIPLFSPHIGKDLRENLYATPLLSFSTSTSSNIDSRSKATSTQYLTFTPSSASPILNEYMSNNVENRNTIAPVAKLIQTSEVQKQQRTSKGKGDRKPTKVKARPRRQPSPTMPPVPTREFFGLPCNDNGTAVAPGWRHITPPPTYKLEPHLCLLRGTKQGLKQDLRILLPAIDNGVLNFSVVNRLDHESMEPTNVVGLPRAFIVARKRLLGHPLHLNSEFLTSPPPALENVMLFMKNQPVCAGKPIFLTMAAVGDDMYWQLIENFVYTMVKFNTSDCSLVICVSDPNCMNLCAKNLFPCYDYRDEKKPLPSVMEQIAAVKLFHIPKALLKGVDVFMLDLDVGFLADPMHMINAFTATPEVDIFVQEDLLFIMNRTKVGWKTWFTEPLPNIGLFLCRGNAKTAKVFSIAWEKYLLMDDADVKAQPGKDQNHVLEGMRIGRGTFGLRYAYFSNGTAVLLDKMTQFVSRTVELGGEEAAKYLTQWKSLAMHSTCYEHVTKVMGLKATNAFWNPKYYDPLRPTITKQLLYTSDLQILDEIRSLMWLAMMSNRTIIIPNLLGSEEIETVQKYQGRQAMWPGFRVSLLKRVKGSNQLKVDIVEPAFYWRVNRDYDDVPEPIVMHINEKETLPGILKRINSLGLDKAPRLVLHVNPNEASLSSSLPKESLDDTTNRVIAWAKSSVGYYPLLFSQEILRYGRLPSIKAIRSSPLASDILQGVRNCMNIFGPLKGNRTCFQICD